jgi:hypothetical protein
MTLIMIFGFFGELDMRKLLMIIHLKAGTGIEPVNSGFADRGLTTWLPRRIGPAFPRVRCSDRAYKYYRDGRKVNEKH